MFWYLATPYTKYPFGMRAAFKLACRASAILMRAGVPVFSPIAHTHPIAEYGDLDPVDGPFWERVDAPMVKAAGGLIMVRALNWAHSDGMAGELRDFNEAGKPVIWWTPDDPVPAELLV